MARREHYNHKKADERHRKKCAAAATRQTLRDGRSNVQQIAKLDAGKFVATKERARLAG